MIKLARPQGIDCDHILVEIFCARLPYYDRPLGGSYIETVHVPGTSDRGAS